jgi:hypothetical protein
VSDFPADFHPHIPGAFCWENGVSVVISPPLFSIRGENIITGQITLLFCLGKSGRESEQIAGNKAGLEKKTERTKYMPATPILRIISTHP